MRFREQEIRALALLLPILIATVVVVVVFRNAAPRGALPDHSMSLATAVDSLVIPEVIGEDNSVAVELTPFDPNTADYDRLRRLGIDKRTAVSIIRYRTAGKVFRIPEELNLCYGMTDSLFAILRPYVQIDAKYALRPQAAAEYPSRSSAEEEVSGERSAILPPSAPFDPNEADEEFFMRIGFSERQARTIINYRKSCGGFRDADQFGRCYAVSEQALECLRDWMVFDSAIIPSAEVSGLEKEIDASETFRNAEHERVELNGADSVALVGLKGIGPWSASEILKYRERLGGYASAEQLLDLQAVTMENYERICEQIWIDSCKIKKIDINFAGPESMAEHPYMTPMRVRKIVKQRKLKGGWSTIEEMTEENILTEDEARRLAPYLQFVQR